MNREKKVILSIGVLAVFVCALVGVHAATAGKPPAVMNWEGGDHLWTVSTSIPHDFEEEEKYFKVKFVTAAPDSVFLDSDTIDFSFGTGNGVQTFAYREKEGYVRDEYCLDNVERVIRVSENTFEVLFDKWLVDSPVIRDVEVKDFYDNETYINVQIGGSLHSNIDLYPTGSAADALTEEQLQKLRKDYPLAADANMEYFYYNTFEEFAEGIPIFALCTVEEQLEDYALELNPKQDLDFEQYVVKVDDCLWNHEESENVANGKGIIVSHRKDDSQFIDLTEGSQVLIPLFAMGGSHTGRYSIANDVGYYMVDGYLLKAYDKDFDLNGLRWDKAKEEIERRLKEYNH